MPSPPPQTKKEEEEEKEDPFQLIERGNALQKSGNYWGAAHALGRASSVLRHQAYQILNNNPTDEKRRIAQLYQTKQREYLYKARANFIQALEFENAEDIKRSKAAQDVSSSFALNKTRSSRNNKGFGVGSSGKFEETLLEPLVTMISSEESARRSQIFNLIFGHMLEEEIEKPKKEEEDEEKTDVAEEEKQEEKDATEEEKAEEQEEAAAVEEEDDDDYDEWEKELESEMNLNEKSDDDNKNKDTTNVEEELQAEHLLPPKVDTFSSETQNEQSKDDDENVDEKQHTLEARLAEFESSMTVLPTIHKHDNNNDDDDAQNKSSSDKERIENIRKSLMGLGMYVPPTEQRKSAFVEKPMSDEDQVDLIVQQAKDEAQFEQGGGEFIAPIGENDGEEVVEDVNTLLANAGMLSKKAKSSSAVGSNNHMTEDDLTKLLNKAAAQAAANANGDKLSKLQTLLKLLSSAQNYLTESSVCLEEYMEEDENDDGDEESESAEVDVSDNDDDDNEVNDDDDNGTKGENETKQQSQDKNKATNTRSIQMSERGMKNLKSAQKCVETLIESWP